MSTKVVKRYKVLTNYTVIQNLKTGRNPMIIGGKINANACDVTKYLDLILKSIHPDKRDLSEKEDEMRKRAEEFHQTIPLNLWNAEVDLEEEDEVGERILYALKEDKYLDIHSSEIVVTRIEDAAQSQKQEYFKGKKAFRTLREYMNWISSGEKRIWKPVWDIKSNVDLLQELFNIENSFAIAMFCNKKEQKERLEEPVYLVTKLRNVFLLKKGAYSMKEIYDWKTLKERVIDKAIGEK